MDMLKMGKHLLAFKCMCIYVVCVHHTGTYGNACLLSEPWILIIAINGR